MSAGSIFPRLPPPALLVASLALVAATAFTAFAQPTPGESPFASAPAPSANAKAAAPAFELLGMSVVGRTTLVGLSRTSDRHSFWIPLGGTIDGITAVSFDAKTDEAVVRIGGQPLTLTLRRASVAPASPAAPAATPSAAPPSAAAHPSAPSPPMPPLTAQEEKEMEARMLVSDLLDIGQQQRKAYEAARKAAAAAPSPAGKDPASKTKP